MLPHQRNKVNLSSLNPDEERLLRMYGKLPSKQDILNKKLKERKYFDSGDYALSKAGKASDVGVTNIGSQHPLPENIPHIHNTPQPGSKDAVVGSPIKEASHPHLKSPMACEEPITGESIAKENEEPIEKPTESKEYLQSEEATNSVESQNENKQPSFGKDQEAETATELWNLSTHDQKYYR